jgi:uncharacterized protein YjbJ (UPF0337 family)
LALSCQGLGPYRSAQIAADAVERSGLVLTSARWLLSPSAKNAIARSEERPMGGKMDQATGKVKEAAGVLVDDKKLEREGKLEHAGGQIKEKADQLADDIKKATGKVVDKVKSLVDR